MGDDNGKSDLSDLKSRLGLDRKDEDGSDEKTDDKVNQKKDDSSASKQNPKDSKPSSDDSSGTEGAPPGPPKQQPPPSVRQTQVITDEDEKFDDEQLESVGGRTITTPVLILLAIALAVGGIIGGIGGSTIQTRQLYKAQKQHASTISDEIQANIDQFNRAVDILEKTSATEVDFEQTKKLGELKLVPDVNLLSGKRLFFGRNVLGPLTSYIIEAGLLERMIEQHRRLTLEVDRERLESLMKSDVAKLSRRVAVSFDYQHLAKRSRKEDYRPRPGQIVEIPESSLKDGNELKVDDEGQIEIKSLNSDATNSVYLRSLVPITKEDLLDAAGPNALQRYKNRVRQLQDQAEQIRQYSDSLLTELQKIANRDSAPLIAF